MDTESPELDAWIDQFTAQMEPGNEQVEAPASAEDPPVSAEEPSDQPEVAVAEALPSTPAPTPDPNLTAQLDAMQAQLAQVSEKAAQFDQLRAAAEHVRQQQEEKVRFEAWQSRMDELENLAPNQRDAEKQRIVSEIRDYRAQQYQSQVAERDSAANEQAKINTAMYLASKAVLTAEQVKAHEEYAKHLLHFDSPEAMQAQIAHDTTVRTGFEQQISALKKQVEELSLAKQAQARIASGADLVGAGGGAPPKGNPSQSIDDWIDSNFR